MQLPMVVRFNGNSYQEGTKLLNEFAQQNGLQIHVGNDLTEMAQLACQISLKQRSRTH